MPKNLKVHRGQQKCLDILPQICVSILQHDCALGGGGRGAEIFLDFRGGAAIIFCVFSDCNLHIKQQNDYTNLNMTLSYNSHIHAIQ